METARVGSKKIIPAVCFIYLNGLYGLGDKTLVLTELFYRGNHIVYSYNVILYHTLSTFNIKSVNYLYEHKISK